MHLARSSGAIFGAHGVDSEALGDDEKRGLRAVLQQESFPTRTLSEQPYLSEILQVLEAALAAGGITMASVPLGGRVARAAAHCGDREGGARVDGVDNRAALVVARLTLPAAPLNKSDARLVVLDESAHAISVGGSAPYDLVFCCGHDGWLRGIDR